MEFFKYHSLGNDFVLLDAINEPQLCLAFNKNTIKSICHRHFGVGADGVLIIHQTSKNKNVQCKIFNSDGSKAELCINGIRCIAHYLFTHHHFPAQFMLDMGRRSIECNIEKNHTPTILITLNTGKAESYKKQTVTLQNKSIEGAFIQFSNPHFIIFKMIDESKLLDEGQAISTHPNFPHQTNVGYITKENSKEKSYDVSFYERGVGITLSCGSGVSAIIWALYQQKKINKSAPITIQMKGGTMQCYIDKDNNIVQKANAHLIFIGDREMIS